MSGAPRIAGTQAEGPEGPRAKALSARGADVPGIPAIAFAPPEDPGPLDHALGEIERFDWIVFTSRHAVEAVIGAAFLDEGFDAACRVGRVLLGAAIDAIDPATSGKDPKTLLQEFLQGRRLSLPQYAVVATRGEAHEQVFEVECLIPELNIRSLGGGTSRRSAEQEAARQAYELATRA